LRDAGAVFAEIMGYERFFLIILKSKKFFRPLWYNTASHFDQDSDGPSKFILK